MEKHSITIPNKKQKKKVTVNILISLFFWGVTLIVYLLPINFEGKLFLLAWIGNFILIWGLSIFHTIKKNFINPYSFFLIVYFLFSYGQIFLYSLGIEYEQFNLVRLFSNEDIISYCLFFLMGTCFFLHGAVYAVRKDYKAFILIDRYKIEDSANSYAFIKSIKIVSWILLMVSAPIYIYDFINSLISSIRYGYLSIYEPTYSNMIANILISFKGWFIPTLFFLLVIYKRNNFLKKVILALLLSIVIGQFVVGGRGGSMALILSSIYLWDSEIKKFRKKDKTLIILCLLIVILLLPIIYNFRSMENKTIEGFITVLTSKESDNLFVDLIGELGSSMQPWLLTNQLIPNIVNFKLGQSYIASFLAIIPSFFLGGYSFTQYANLGNWLMDTLNMSYGPGFSILAESYYNFGWFGVPFMFFIGWLYYKLLSNNLFKGPIIKYKNVLSAIALYMFTMNVRGSLYLTIRNEIYFIVLPILLTYLVYNTLKKKGNMSSKMYL